MNTRHYLLVGLGAGLVLGTGLVGCGQPNREVVMDRPAAPRPVVASVTEQRGGYIPQTAAPAPASYDYGSVTAPIAPPLTRIETPSRRLNENEFWVGGHWRWSGNTHTWEDGRIETVRPGQMFVPAGWTETNGAWTYLPERWR